MQRGLLFSIQNATLGCGRSGKQQIFPLASRYLTRENRRWFKGWWMTALTLNRIKIDRDECD